MKELVLWPIKIYLAHDVPAYVTVICFPGTGRTPLWHSLIKEFTPVYQPSRFFSYTWLTSSIVPLNVIGDRDIQPYLVTVHPKAFQTLHHFCLSEPNGYFLTLGEIMGKTDFFITL